MKKVRKRLAGLLAALMLVSAVFPGRSYAEEEIETDRSVSLTVSIGYEGEALEGVSYQLYQVAGYAEKRRLLLTEDFESYPIVLDENSIGVDTALTLSAYAERDRLMPKDEGKTGSDGLLTFPTEGKTLLPGIFLLVSSPFSKGGYTYETSPVLVSLPGYDESTGGLAYHLTSIAKTERTEQKGETLSLSVIKLWKGDQEENRPQKIEVRLLCNEEVYDTVTLTAQKGWQYDWEGLPGFGVDGSVNHWTVTESAVEGYTAEITSTGTAFLITNTAVESQNIPITPRNLPKTGLLWWPVPIFLLTGTVCLVLGYGIKRRKNKETANMKKDR